MASHIAIVAPSSAYFVRVIYLTVRYKQRRTRCSKPSRSEPGNEGYEVTEFPNESSSHGEYENMLQKYCTGIWGTPIPDDIEFVNGEVPDPPEGLHEFRIDINSTSSRIGTLIMHVTNIDQVRGLFEDKTSMCFRKVQTPSNTLNICVNYMSSDFALLVAEKLHALCNGMPWYIQINRYCLWDAPTITANLYSPVLDQTLPVLVYNESAFEFDVVRVRDVADKYKSLLYINVGSMSNNMLANVAIKKEVENPPSGYGLLLLCKGVNTKGVASSITRVTNHFGDDLRCHYDNMMICFGKRDNDNITPVMKCTESTLLLLSKILPISPHTMRILQINDAKEASSEHVYDFEASA